METGLVLLVFVLALAAYFALHVRAGLAQDAQWSRQQMLAGHGVRLGLPARAQETTRAFVAATAPGSGRSEHVTTATAPLRPGGPERGAPSLASAD